MAIILGLVIFIFFSAIFLLKIDINQQSKDKPVENAKKSIVVAERIIEDCPFRGDLKKKQYAIALEIIGEKYKEILANDNLKILTSFTNSVEDGFKLAKQENSIAVVGYYNSLSALEASVLAKKYEIPYVSPVSPLSEINNEFSVSLATNHDFLIKYFKKASNSLQGNSIILSSEDLSVVEQGYINLYKKSFDIRAVLTGNSSKTLSKLSAYFKTNPTKPLNILFSGYAYDQLDLVRKINEAFPNNNITYITHSNWVYMEHIFKESLPLEGLHLYVISDFYPYEPSEVENFSKKAFNFYFSSKQYITNKDKSLFEPIVFSFLNAIKFSLDIALNSKTTQEFNYNMTNTSDFDTYQNFNIVNKQTQKKVYLLRWKDKKLGLEKIL